MGDRAQLRLRIGGQMPVVLVGLDHRSVAPFLKDRIALDADGVTQALELLTKSEHLTEAVVLATCMRTEVYVEAVRFHGAVHDIRSMFSHVTGVDGDEFRDSLLELHDEAAYQHLFRVAAGVESSVVGESEVLGQVVRAWNVARQADACKSVLGGLFRHAVEVGKRVRTETAIAQGVASIGKAAVVMADEKLGGLSNRRVLIIGAGDMGDSLAVAVSCASGVGEVLVSNRTRERAASVAERTGGTVVPFEELDEVLPTVDLVLTSTGSPDPLLTEERMIDITEARENKPIVIVDVAVPRDVDAEVGTLPGVTLLDMSDLHTFAERGRRERRQEIERVDAIVAEEVRHFAHDVTARSVAPTIASLRTRAEDIRRAEVSKQQMRLGLTPEQQVGVDALTKSILSKLLHDPSVQLKNAAGTPEGERMAEAIRRLFGI